MDRLELVELIEGQAARLTHGGRDLAGPFATEETQRAQVEEEWYLSPRDRNILERLLMLSEGLERADAAERRGETGERYRDLAATGAAGLKDRFEDRMIDPDMTPEQALARLREPG